ncbi:MAG: hypothetical protein K6F30_05000 [Lachnospiraceae bacterium]|nr:hypothetical protein [Lachnospiraceae bacterium]
MKTKLNKNYMLYFLLACFGMFLYTFDNHTITSIQDSLRISYEDGLVSRGLIGTIYNGLDALFPFSLFEEGVQVRTLLIGTVVVYLLLAFMVKKSMAVVDESLKSFMGYFFMGYAMLFVGTFSAKRNFGGLHLFMIAVTILGIMAILFWNCKWLCLPLSIVGVLIDVDYSLLYFGILFFILLYEYEERKRKMDLVLLWITTVIQVGVFLYFQLEEHSVLGKENEYRMQNIVEFPIYLMLISPYLYIGGRYLIEVFRQIPKEKRGRYFGLVFGSILVLPCFLFENQYGRFFFALLTYYVLIFTYLVVKKDVYFVSVLKAAVEKNKGNQIYLMVFAGTILLVPYWDRHISSIVYRISDVLNGEWLHLW